MLLSKETGLIMGKGPDKRGELKHKRNYNGDSGESHCCPAKDSDPGRTSFVSDYLAVVSDDNDQAEKWNSDHTV